MPIFGDAELRRVEGAIVSIHGVVDTLRKTAEAILEPVLHLQRTIENARVGKGHVHRAPTISAPPARPREVAPRRSSARDRASGLGKQAEAMLEELTRRHPMRLTPTQLAALSGYSTKSSQFRPALRDLLAASG